MFAVAQEPPLRALHWTGEEAVVSQTDFDGAVDGFRQALRSFVTGDPLPVTEFFSRRDDVTLANPLGPPRIGPADVDQAIAAAAANLKDGSIRGFEEVSRYSTPDLGYVVQIERTEARLPGSDDMSPFALRVTMIFRREGDTWKVRTATPTPSRPLDRSAPSSRRRFEGQRNGRLAKDHGVVALAGSRTTDPHHLSPTEPDHRARPYSACGIALARPISRTRTATSAVDLERCIRS